MIFKNIVSDFYTLYHFALIYKSVLCNQLFVDDIMNNEANQAYESEVFTQKDRPTSIFVLYQTTKNPQHLCELRIFIVLYNL